MGLDDLGYLTDRPAQPVPKGKTRLEQIAGQRPLTKVDEQQFRNEVWARDNYRCRCCHRAVLRTIDLVPEQGQVHHIHGRRGDLRFESRAALLLCAFPCHARCKGRVNAPALLLVATKTFTLRGEAYTDARFPIVFKETR